MNPIADIKTKIIGSVDPLMGQALLDQILYVESNFQVYKNLFREIGLSREYINSRDPFETLTKIPPLTKSKFQKLITESITGTNKIIDLETSSGTTGNPKRRFITDKDESSENDLLTTLFNTAGLRAIDSVACVDTGPLSLMVSFFEPLSRIPVKEYYAISVSRNIEATVEELNILKPTVIISVPSILDRLIKSNNSHLEPWSINLEKVIYVGEMMREQTRVELVNGRNIEVFSYYGTAETSAIGIECGSHNGIHVDTNWNIIESMYSGSFQKVETVTTLFTSLKQKGLPLIRYPLDDTLEYLSESCPCKNPSPKVKITGRIKESVSILGVKTSYRVIYDAVMRPLNFFEAIDISVNYDSNGNESITLTIPDQLKTKSAQIRKIMNTEVPEISYLLSSGFLSLKLDFVPKDQFSERKNPFIKDMRI